MQYKKIILALICLSSSLYAESDQQLLKKIQLLQQQTEHLQSQLNTLQKNLTATSGKDKHRHSLAVKQKINDKNLNNKTQKVVQEDHSKYHYHSTHVLVHAPEPDSEAIGFYPTALIAEQRVVTYIAGTPVVTSPYLGARPAFDGSDYIVNISSINRDIRLMQQRRSLYRAYESIGYPAPPMPIIALSGKAEPIGIFRSPFRVHENGDLNLGSSELDVAAALNQNVEAFVSIAYDETPPDVGPRVDNSAFNLNMGFVNIGNLDNTPFYFTAGQMYVPFGRYSSAMISSPLTMNLARTKTRPFILGYKSQEDIGPFAAVYIYKSDTTLGTSTADGANIGYNYQFGNLRGEIGASYISSLNDSTGMQNTNSTAEATFGGFGSFTNGSELVRKTKAVNLHGNISYDRFILAGEWIGAIEGFRAEDLSYNGRAAKPQAAQTELDMTFRVFNRPSSVGIGYQWSKDALALSLPQKRFIAMFNTSIWKDTVESIEYKHDIDYNIYQSANGAAPIGSINNTIYGTGHSADALSLKIGVYF